MCVYKHMPLHTYEHQTVRFPFPPLWEFQGSNSKYQALAARAFTHWALIPAPQMSTHILKNLLRREWIITQPFCHSLYRCAKAEKAPSYTHRTPGAYMPRSARPELTGSQGLRLGTGITVAIAQGIVTQLTPNLSLLHPLSTRGRTLGSSNSCITMWHKDLECSPLVLKSHSLDEPAAPTSAT